MVAGVVLLALVLVPGIGVEVNGSQRWIALGPLRVQPSELMKLAMIVYMADYLTRRRAQLRSFRLGVVNVGLVVALVAVLLLFEPDLGTTVVLAATVFAMMYLSGVRYLHMALCVAAAAAAFAVLVYVSPYRLERVLSFQNPRADPFDSGFQLSQALIAFGRGEWFGAGLGQSIQKLYYLPHAANDFLAAVIAEELGLAGIVALIGLYVAFTWRGFSIAAAAEKAGHHFAARLVHGATFLVALQAIVNLGVNMGVLPTKGLTLPLMSYGGSSMIVTLCMVGLIFGVDRQLRAPAAGRRAR
ncbi:MAG: putative lipid II flippase FtsW [Gammaproteobacteria bacterium]|nr:putative lipid II flippase FtsW [Gammaproteobacteria bacterium]